MELMWPAMWPENKIESKMKAPRRKHKDVYKIVK